MAAPMLVSTTSSAKVTKPRADKGLSSEPCQTAFATSSYVCMAASLEPRVSPDDAPYKVGQTRSVVGVDGI